MDQKHLMRIRNGVRFFYDLQKLRIQTGNRNTKQAELAALEEEDRQFMDTTSQTLESLEKEALREVKRLLKGAPIWEQWLKKQKGVAETLGGLFLAEIFIEHCHTVSQLWTWCGLATLRACVECDTVVDERPIKVFECKCGYTTAKKPGEKLSIYCPKCDEKMEMTKKLYEEIPSSCPKCGSQEFKHISDRMIRGQQCDYNPWLKSKIISVLGGCLLKSNSPWRKFYDDYKTRKTNQRVPVCMQCKGSGTTKREEKLKQSKQKVKNPKKKVKCWNCEGTGGPAPWGKSDKHRHAAAQRYMVKQFMSELWVQWRTLEGLPVRKPYAEEYLDRPHHGPKFEAASHLEQLSP